MAKAANGNKGVFKVEKTYSGPNQVHGVWVAMVSRDATGPERFYGTEESCWKYIDSKRAEWKEDGTELSQQISSVLNFQKAA